MKIIIDAMGGDNAPGEIVLGAIEAAKEFGVEVILVGRGDELLSCMQARGIATLPAGVEIANADAVVDIHDDPANVVRDQKNSSMVIGAKMLADGLGDAFISAGSTGALLTAATLLVRRVRGVRRAAVGPIIPTQQGSTMLIDGGANAECTPEFLLQFGCMGSIYVKKVLGIPEPTVGLLNNGTEEGKGTPLHKEAFSLLQEADRQGLLRFAGNVEARQVPLGDVDVVVADGFSGNVLLKGIEGTAASVFSMMKSAFQGSLRTKLGAWLCKGALRKVKRQMDYREVGGTMLIGINKPVIKAHGSSDARAIRSAVQQAIQAVESGIAEEIQANMEQIREIKEQKNAE